MLLHFADGTELNVRSIIGSPQNRNGINRDVLIIEVDPSEATLEELQILFKDETKTSKIITITKGLISTDDGIQMGDITNVIGEHYTIYLSVTNTIREKLITIGAPIEMEEINIVEIAQKTQTELLLEQLQKERRE